MFLGTLFVVVALIGAAYLQEWGPLRHSPRTRVAVFGDSLTAQSSWRISRSLVDAGYDPAVSGLNGAAIADFDPHVRSYTGYQGAEVMVIALGTNNAFYASPQAPRKIDLASSIDELRKVAGDAIEPVPGTAFPLSVRCLVWVNLNDRATALELDQNAPTINQAIRDEAEMRNRAGRQMLIADWNSRSQGHPEWFVSDGVHLNEDGQDAFSGLIRETVQRCRL